MLVRATPDCGPQRKDPGITSVLGVGRRGSAQSDHYPWILYDTAKLHVGIMAGLAGFAFAGIVLVVSLARDRPGVAGSSLDTVIVMFLVAYLWWVGNAFLISYLPHDETSGELVPRVHFSLASTIEYRTVFLSRHRARTARPALHSGAIVL